MNYTTSSSVHTETERIRNQIIARFLEDPEGFVSGSMLSSLTGVTRTAVWKHIHFLEEIGFVFETLHGMGYRLKQVPNLVMEPLLQRRLSATAELGRTVKWLASTASTNTIANTIARDGAPHGTLICAMEQHGGRGRRGRVWFAPKEGLWQSLLLKKPFALARASELTLITSVVLRRVLVQHTGLPIRIKWPNDLLCNGKKICGILAEIRAEGEHVLHATLGVGINTNIPETAFPDAIRAHATSLLAESNQAVNHLSLTADFLSQFEPLYESLVSGGHGFQAVTDAWREASATLGQRVRVQTSATLLEGIAVELDDHGILYIKDDSGVIHSVHSGDVLF